MIKQRWERIAAKIDGRSLRERAIIFAMAAMLMLVLIHTFLLNPQYEKQKQLSQRIKQDQVLVAAMQTEIQQKARQRAVDPDRDNKLRLQQVTEEASRVKTELRVLQKGLVPPDKMPALLEDIVRSNTALRVLSVKTLPAISILGQAGETVKKPETSEVRKTELPTLQDGAGTETSLYKHGVEIVVQGGYIDLLNYLAQLETMPWQLLWDDVRLSVDEYPTATMTLTLSTLGLNKKWLSL